MNKKKILLALFILKISLALVAFSGGNHEQVNNRRGLANIHSMESNLEHQLRGCINPEFRNTSNGLLLCANYTDDTNISFNLVETNCTLLYWNCCQDSTKNDTANTTSKKICTLINKCPTHYQVKTCVTPLSCNQKCMQNNEVFFNLFDNSTILDNDAPNKIKDLIQNKSEVFVNLAQKEWIRSSQCVGEWIDRKEGGTTNCCTKCETQYYTTNGNLIFNYDVPELNKTDMSPILLAANVSSSFRSTALKDKDWYFSNQCNDSRVMSIFGLDKIDEEKYQMLCHHLAYDWGQFFATYECNDYFCNKRGNCILNTDNTMIGVAVPSCNCTNGYKGKNCMFPKDDYDFLKKYVDTLDNWIDSYVKILDQETLVSFIRILQNIITFSSNCEPKDKVKYSKTVQKFWYMIANADNNHYPSKEFKRNFVIFQDSLLYNTNSITGMNPYATTAILSKYEDIAS